MIYNAAQILTKISFLIQYRKLFPSDRVRLICLCLLVFIAAWGIAQESVEPPPTGDEPLSTNIKT